MFDAVDPMTGGYDQAVLQDLQRQQAQLNMNLAQYQLNFDKLLEQLDMTLRGIVKDPKDGSFKQMYTPVLNEEGRTHFIKKHRSWFNKIIAQSNYTDEQINAWCLVYTAELITDIVYFGDRWDLRAEEYTSLENDLLFSVHGVMLLAKDAGFRDILGKITKVQETINNMMPQRRGLVI